MRAHPEPLPTHPPTHLPALSHSSLSFFNPCLFLENYPDSASPPLGVLWWLDILPPSCVTPDQCLNLSGLY